jgi:hypothetical protein
MHSYQLKSVDRFLFVHLPEGPFLLDTGVGPSFCNSGRLTFAGVSHAVPPMLGHGAATFSTESIREATDARCVGALGLAMLSNHRFMLDVPGQVMLVGDDAWDGIAPNARKPIDASIPAMFGGMVFLRASIEGAAVTAVLDTGARYSYALGQELAFGGIPMDPLDDYNPILGHFRAESARVGIALLCGSARVHAYEDRIAQLPAQHLMMLAPLAAARVPILIGNAWMRDVRVGMDLRDRHQPTAWIAPSSGEAC